MKILLKIKNRHVEINLNDELTPVEINYIQTLLDDEILKLEKETPDTLRVLSTLLAKYCVLYYLANKKLKLLNEELDKRVDEIIRSVKEWSSDNTLF